MSDIARLTIRVGAETSPAVRALDSLQRRLDRMNKSFNLKIGADTAKVSADLDKLNAKLDRVARNRRVKIDVDSSGMDKVAREAIAAGDGIGRLQLLAAAAVPATQILGPSLLVAAGGAAALGTAAVTAGAGLGVFALAWDALGKAGKKAALAPLKTQFDAWGQSVKRFTLAPVNAAVSALNGQLPKLNPLLAATSATLAKGAAGIGAWLRTKEFSEDIKKLSAAFQPIVGGLGAAVGNILRGVLNLVIQAIPFTERFVGWFKNLSATFLAWTQNKGATAFQGFLAKVLAFAPQVGAFFTALWQAVVRVTTALSGMPNVTLTLATAMLKLIASMPKSVIQGIAIAFTALTLAIKLWSVASKIAAASNPWILLFTAIAVAAYLLLTHWKTVKAGLITAWNAVRDGFVAGWHFMYNNVIHPLVNFFTSTIPNAAKTVWHAIATAWGNVKNSVSAAYHWLVTNVFSPIGNFFTHTLPAAATTVWHAVTAAFQFIKNGLSKEWNWIRSNILTPVVNFFTHTIPSAAGTVSRAVVRGWDGLKNGVHAAYSWLVTNVFDKIKNFFTNTIPGWAHTLAHGVSSIWSDLWKGVKSIASGAWNWLKNTVKSFGNDFKGAFSAIKNGVKSIWNDLKDIFKAPISFFVNTVYDKGVVPAWNATAGKVGLGTLKTAHFATGGHVSGPGGPTADKVPAMLSNGEFVVRAAQARKHRALLEQINGPGLASRSTVQNGVIHAGWGWNPINDIKQLGHDIGSGAKKAFDWAKKTAGFAADYGRGLGAKAFRGIWDHTVGPLANMIPTHPEWSRGIHNIPGIFETKIANWIGGKSQAAKKAAGSAGGDTGARSGSAKVAQQYAASQMSKFGWDAMDMAALIKLWNQESGWNAYAVNKSSGAAGIAQSLGHGKVTLGDYVGQINWGLNYIKGRYGSPTMAWAHEMANNWYRIGSNYTRPGLSIVGERGPELIHTSAGSQVMTARETAAVLSGNGGRGGSGGGTVVYETHVHVTGASVTDQKAVEDLVVKGITSATRKGRLK